MGSRSCLCLLVLCATACGPADPIHEPPAGSFELQSGRLQATDVDVAVDVAAVSRVYFGELLPLLGRRFVQAEYAAEAQPVVMRHESFWRTELNGDLALIGDEIRLDGRAYRVVGVMPDYVYQPADVDVWLPRPR